MDAQTCLNKLRYVGVLSFATVDREGNPQVRNISAIHYEPDALYFFTARGKDFCKELLARGKAQILGYTRYKEMIRLSGTAAPVSPGEQEKWRDLIFAEQPYLSNVYPGETRSIGIVFCIRDMAIEYFHLGVNPPSSGRATPSAKDRQSPRATPLPRTASAAAPVWKPAHSGPSPWARPTSSTRSTASTAATVWSIAPWRPLYQGSRRPSLRKLNEGFVWAIGGRGFLFWQCQPEEHFPSTSHLWFSLEYVLECRIFNNNKSDFL